MNRAVTWWIIFVTGCTAEALGQTDTFREELARGCNTREACDLLVAHAQANVAKCAPNTIGAVRCRDANADLVEANAAANAVRQAAAKSEQAAFLAKRDADRKAAASAAQRADCEAQIERRNSALDQWERRKAEVEAENKSRAEVQTWVNANCSRVEVNRQSFLGCPTTAPIHIVQAIGLAPDQGRLIAPFRFPPPPTPVPTRPKTSVSSYCEPAPTPSAENPSGSGL